MKKDNVKKHLFTILIFSGVSIVSIPFFMFAFFILVMSTDGGMNTMSIFNPLNILGVSLMTLIISGIALPAHLVGLFLLKDSKLEKKNLFSRKTYKILIQIIVLLIFSFMCFIHFDFSFLH